MKVHGFFLSINKTVSSVVFHLESFRPAKYLKFFLKRKAKKDYLHVELNLLFNNYNSFCDILNIFNLK